MVRGNTILIVYACVVFLGVLAGVLESEGFAKNGYPRNFNKTYEIEVSEGKRMKIEFTDLDLECICNNHKLPLCSV